ncbi:MAG TPA: hypothetical protein VLB84_00500 [Bacteroidia bacterium]|nr:hypothetical protein [Bacteroidia bacterium]
MIEAIDFKVPVGTVSYGAESILYQPYNLHYVIVWK